MTKPPTLTDLPHKILAEAMRAGMEENEGERAASYLHQDRKTIYSRVNEAFEGKIEVSDIRDALEKHDWLVNLMWANVKQDDDETTKAVARDYSGGYFMRILPGAKVDFPLQSCLMMGAEKQQKVHNIIIAEEDSDARIISGCVSDRQMKEGEHLGVTEFYIRKNASLNFTMIHSWGENMKVRPKSAATIDDGGTFISNYVCLQPVKDLRMYPKAYCVGENSRARFNNIIYLSGKSHLSAGSLIDFQGKGSSGEIISRNIVKDEAYVEAPARLLGNNTKIKAHMECRGLILNDGATVSAIPELKSSYRDVEMSHEAAVGKIADKEINYLMSRGLNADEATSTIVRGFLDTDILGLPQNLKTEVDDIIEQLIQGM
jgi:uncharacterized protein